MTITHRELLDTSIAQLETLVAFLRDQLGETGGSPQVRSDALEVRACGEVLLSLSALIRKVQVARWPSGPEACPVMGIKSGKVVSGKAAI
jgi:hypothetical protein